MRIGDGRPGGGGLDRGRGGRRGAAGRGTLRGDRSRGRPPARPHSRDGCTRRRRQAPAVPSVRYPVIFAGRSVPTPTRRGRHFAPAAGASFPPRRRVDCISPIDPSPEYVRSIGTPSLSVRRRRKKSPGGRQSLAGPPGTRGPYGQFRPIGRVRPAEPVLRGSNSAGKFPAGPAAGIPGTAAVPSAPIAGSSGWRGGGSGGGGRNPSRPIRPPG